jgi:hypothetical protein
MMPARQSFDFNLALQDAAQHALPTPLDGVTARLLERIRQGRFQRSLCLLVASTSAASGLEVGYEHYKGSFSNPVMYTPVVLSGVLAVAGGLGFFSQRAARTVLRTVSILTLADGAIGFFFHIRGIARKPGGWRLPVTNIVMGPPIFAPLLFGTSAYLGLIASHLRRENDSGGMDLGTALIDRVSRQDSRRWTNLRHGRSQKHLCVVTIAWAFFSGLEALYSHYKTNFRYKAQWTPVLLAPLLMAVAAGGILRRRIANTLLPAVSTLALADGAVGFYYHARGITRRAGGMKKPLYNILYGPPIFAPLLFAACGLLGMMASLLRRERA